MNTEMKQLLGELRTYFLKASAVAFVTSLATFLFKRRQTVITVDDEIPAELYTMGKKGNPKAVYLTTKRHTVNFFPALLLLLLAVAAQFCKNRVETDIQ